jgi:pyruvate/2-oxoglutarate dehydrogenase complex dihydrolipoamide dehydrogenase (E3) component
MHIVVLGGGSSGEHFVGAFRRFDRESRLTLVESHLVGGECSYWACMPTKTMLRPLELLAATRRTPGVGEAQLDPQAVFDWRDTVAARDDSSQVAWLAERDCALVRGRATSSRSGAITVAGEEIRYDRLVIASGSRASIPPIPGIETTGYWTNVGATEARRAPDSLLVLGGGPVGCELAQFFARMGSRVTLVEAERRLLSGLDPEAAALVTESLRADGVELLVSAGVERFDGQLALLAPAGEERRFERVLIATGRQPNVEGLDGLGLTLSRRGIVVDERLRAAPSVWAIGDVTGIAPFTHVGKYHARVAAADIAGRPARADHRAVPATIFTDPQVASVGTLAGKISSWPLSSTPRLSTYERPKRPGFIKLAADPQRRVLTGAVAVGPEAGEWLQQLTLAIRAEVPVELLLDVIPPYPTFSEAVFLALRELNFDLD